MKTIFLILAVVAIVSTLLAMSLAPGGDPSLLMFMAAMSALFAIYFAIEEKTP